MVAILKPPARSLVVAPRLPAFPKEHTGNPFTSDGDVVVDCDVDGCGYHAMGPRPLMKKALDDHHRQCHASAQAPLVTLLNHPRL